MTAVVPIPVRVDVNEIDKTADILIPWERITRVDSATSVKWFRRAAKLRAAWEAKGYKFQ
jgi:hypothetical protein